MATIQFGGGVTAMSGSIAGNTFARNRAGYYVRPRTKPVNPSSANQLVIRNAMQFLTQRWHDTLSAEQRTAWATYAAAIPLKNRLGQIFYATGFNMYLAVNIFRIQNGNSKCDDGPVTLSLPEVDTGLTLAAYASTQKLHIEHTTELPWTTIPASIMGIYMGRPQQATINFFNGPWRRAGLINGNGVSPSDITAPFTLIAGQKVWVYGRICTGPTDARLGNPMILSCTVLSEPPE